MNYPMMNAKKWYGSVGCAVGVITRLVTLWMALFQCETTLAFAFGRTTQQRRSSPLSFLIRSSNENNNNKKGAGTREVRPSSSSPSSLSLSSLPLSEGDYYNNPNGSNKNKNKNNNNIGIAFEQLSDFNTRVESLESSAPETLASFFEPHLLSFSVKPGSANRLSILSTCYSLLAIMEGDKGLYEPFVNYDIADTNDSNKSSSQKSNKIPVGQILPELLNSQWKSEDLFQVSLILLTLLRFDNNNNNQNNKDGNILSFLHSMKDNEATVFKIQTLISTVLSKRPKRVYGSDQQLSGYMNYLCCQVYCSLQSATTTSISENNDNNNNDDESIVSQILPDGAASEIPLALARCSEFSFNELCRQISFHSAGDTTSFDVMRMTYSLLTYIKSTEHLSGIAGITEIEEPGSRPLTKPLQQNRRIVKEGLRIFFEEQGFDGMWAQGQPIFRSFRRQGRNIGNAFVFAIDTLASLLQALPAEDFRPHLPAIERTLGWIESHQMVEVIADYCDPISGQCFGKPLRGWISPHVIQTPGPEAWSTAQVVRCIHRMKRTIRELMHKDVLGEFNGEPLSLMGKRSDSWDNLLDSDLGISSRTIKSVLEERVIQPFSNGVDNPSFGMVYSAILFGPPGTAKTTICESLAKTMGWDFVVVDTANFLANGSANIASTIRYVFKRLMALKECVILFDEIEEFCLNRDTPGLSMESRMLTTAMLTAINDLRRTKQSVFFVATNRLSAFDSAITRPGRFDMQLYVGTPNLNSRVIQFEQQLSSIAVMPAAPALVSASTGEEEDNDTINGSITNGSITKATTLKQQKEQAIESYRSFLQSVWSPEGDAMFLNFLEGKQFAKACANIVASGRELTKEEMEGLLKQQAAVMTVRGSVREEYITSMELSRL